MALQLIGTDISGSALLALSDGTPQDLVYSVFGNLERGEGVPMSIPGFNGERNDPMSGVTHLGNGYRAFNPTLMRFNCPDSESPFGAGGINAYAYCANDPVNLKDPNGKIIGEILEFFLVERKVAKGLSRKAARIAARTAAAKATKAVGRVSVILDTASFATSEASNYAESDTASHGLNTATTVLGSIGLAGTFSALIDLGARGVHKAKKAKRAGDWRKLIRSSTKEIGPPLSSDPARNVIAEAPETRDASTMTDPRRIERSTSTSEWDDAPDQTRESQSENASSDGEPPNNGSRRSSSVGSNSSTRRVSANSINFSDEIPANFGIPNEAVNRRLIMEMDNAEEFEIGEEIFI